MSLQNPLNANLALASNTCSCGRHSSQTLHDEALVFRRAAARSRRRIRGRARHFSPTIRADAHSCAKSAPPRRWRLFHNSFPCATLPKCLPKRRRPEKQDLKVGFIPITCATPIIMAHPMGFYSKHKINVEVVKTAGWA